MYTRQTNSSKRGSKTKRVLQHKDLFISSFLFHLHTALHHCGLNTLTMNSSPHINAYTYADNNIAPNPLKLKFLAKYCPLSHRPTLRVSIHTLHPLEEE